MKNYSYIYRNLFYMKRLLLTLASVMMLAICCHEPAVDESQNQNPDYQAPTPPEEPNEDYDGLTRLTFEESEKNFPNPERGFYVPKDRFSSSLSKSDIQAARVQAMTLFYLGYYPTKYMSSDIPESFLNDIRADMQLLRDNGAKCIFRVAYKNNQNDMPSDPTPEWVARHIEQLKPVFQEYGDVIMVLQAGFIGTWGEWYYTDNFYFNPRTPEDHKLRKEVVDALLDAMPKDRSIGLRTPMFKRMMYADSYTDTLTLHTAYDGSDKARISGFNDCFGASADDYGTFEGKETREYWKKDTRYVLMGGETCGVSDYCRCTASLKDMEDYHWTYLNSAYNKKVHSVWENGGCMDEVKLRLGYRLSLSEVYHSPEAVAGQDFRVVLKIRNTGFAAPMNGRAVEIVLVDAEGGKTVYECDVDPRYWFAGQTATVDKTLTLPADLEGGFALYLNLPDPKPTLHDNPMFSIRLANDGVWDDKTGYNMIYSTMHK